MNPAAKPMTYVQLRQILGIVLTNAPVRTTLADLISPDPKAKEPTTAVDLIDTILATGVDTQIIAILGHDPDTISAVDGLEVILGFFQSISASSLKLSAWLPATASPLKPVKTKETSSK